MIHYEAGYLAQALELLDSRLAGTCELSYCQTREESLELARKKGAADLVIIDKDGEKVEPV
jgi:ATP phosphoribosyltransferase regulatory subunit